ncbi:unnamed protein product [Chironomus riparius]|uniref:Chitin-binding type-2 domain-containing protein n=1 Tax=Chironomus riparius TaxID=315576 RepID=A0A9N9S6D3_9DIPT|nr:unnamed protein product [Chironomus riparius]
MAIKIILVPILVIFLSFGNIESAEVNPDICKGNNFGFLAHPDPQRCTEYIICFFEEPYFFTCAYPDQIFFLPYTYCVKGDPITCQVLVNVTTLSPSTTTTTSTTTLSTTTSTSTTTTTTTEATTEATTTTTTESSIDTTTRITLPNDICKGLNFSVLAHPHNCTKFIVCLYEIPNVAACQNPYMIFYNGSCVPGDPFSCEVYGPTTTTPKEIESTITERTTGPPELCVGYDFKLVQDPNYCFRFFYCILGVALPGQCDPNKIFDEQFRGCVDGDWNTCERGQ